MRLRRRTLSKVNRRLTAVLENMNKRPAIALRTTDVSTCTKPWGTKSFGSCRRSGIQVILWWAGSNIAAPTGRYNTWSGVR